MSTPTTAIDISKIVRVVPRNRNIELMLLLFAMGINAFELAQIQLSTIEILTLDLLTYWAPWPWPAWPSTWYLG